jgi:anti-sigma factor (TIGR02949 family)
VSDFQPDADDNPCAKLMRHLWTLLDGECTKEFTQDDREELLAHLKDCPPCEDHYQLEERINALIATKCQGEAAPSGLRERLLVEISRTTIIRGR